MNRAPRREGDFYPTPQALADKITGHAAAYVSSRNGRPPRILEPSAGSGVFVRACHKVWPEARIVAIEPDEQHAKALSIARPWVGMSLEDYAKNVRPLWRDAYGAAGDTFDLIIGNPPFSHALEHVRLCLDMLAPGGALVFLLRLGFLESKGRAAFFREHPPTRVDVLPERPSFCWTLRCGDKLFPGCGHKWTVEPGHDYLTCPECGGTRIVVTKTDAASYAVFTWRQGFEGATELGWL